MGVKKTEMDLFTVSDTELGFMPVISVEPILNCLNHYNLLPQIQKDV